MNYKDVALVNGSLDSLSDNLLKQKVMQQQAQEKQQQLGIEQGRVDVDQARMEGEQARGNAAEQHYKNIEAGQTTATAARAKSNTLRTWGDTVKMFGGWVQDGIVDPNVAQQKLSQAYAAMPDPQKEALADHPAVKAIQDGTPLWKAPPARPKMQPAAVATDNAAQDLEDQADDMQDEDPDGAQQLRDRAQLLRDHLKKNPARAPIVRKSVTTKDSTGGGTTISGPADQVDALKPPAAAASTPARKAARANALQSQNPNWTRQQVIDQVNREMP